MEIRIIYGSTLLVMLLVNMSMALVYWTRRTYPGFGYWLAGSFCRSTGAVLFLLPRDQFPPWLAIILANYLFLAEILIIIRGTMLFRGEPLPRYRRDIAVTLSFWVLFTYFVYPAPDGTARIMIFSLYCCGLDLWMLQVLLVRRPAYFGATEVCQAWVWGILAALNFVRAGYTWAFEQRNVDIMAASPIQLVMVLALALVAILIAFTQIIMNAQRIEYDYSTAHERLERELIERKRSEEELGESEARFRSLFEHAMEGIFQTAPDGRILMINPAMAYMLGYDSPRDAMARVTSIPADVYADPREQNALVDRVLREGPLQGREIRFRKKDGRTITVAMNLLAVRNERGDPLFFEGSCIDITARVHAEEALHDRDQLLSLIINNIPGCVAQIDREFRYRFINNQYERVSGLTPDMVLGRTVVEVFGREVHQRLLPSMQRALNGETVTLEAYIKDPKGKTVYGINTYMPDFSPEGTIRGIIAISIDVTELKSAQAKQRRLEEQLMQAQKIESIGRLAGGIAHDFNNMLGIIMGYTELAMQKVAHASPLHKDLDEVRKAAERSANLTRQLLAFARKQIASPKVLDLNETVEGTLKMLKRLIGEDINLSWLPGAGVWQINVDPSQIDQILANLCVNARDAIDGVGNLIIGTENVVLGETACMAHPQCIPGEYVLLTVGDDGCGMDRKTINRIFEPFFTTKGLGKGTGLGLSTVYGIVRQNSGFINVYSEPGLGTTFKIYLPRHRSETEPIQEEDSQQPVAPGNETILLVEDEPSVLGMTREMLEREGYTVLAAGSPEEAVRLAEIHAGQIQLLMTDVVMPGMNGLDLARKLSSLVPNLKQLFVSGYTADIIARQGVLNENVHFLQKPLPKHALAAKLREMLGGEGG